MPNQPEKPTAPVATRTPFDVEGAADYIGVSASFLNKARLTGLGPAFLKLGSRVQYEQHDLDAWLNSRRRTSTSHSAGSTNRLEAA